MIMVRLKKDGDKFVTINQQLVSDSRLSWKARGIFVYLWNQADNWQFYVEEITNHATDGKKSLISGLKELETFGYLKRINRHKKDGSFDGKEWILKDHRQPPLGVNAEKEQKTPILCQKSVNAEKGRTRNGTLTNTNNNKYQNTTNKYIQCKPDKQVMHDVKNKSIKQTTQEFNQQVKDEFNKLWGHYPNKKGKQQAFSHYKAWRKKSKANTYMYLANKLVTYIKYIKLNADWYHPMNGSTWFNGRFDDELETEKLKVERIEGTGMSPEELLKQQRKAGFVTNDEKMPF